jgi:hypothetical protein
LGEGLNQGIQGYLWSEKEMPVKLIFQLQPGPGREDSIRNIEVAFFWYGAYGSITDFTLIQDVQIDEPEVFEMVVHLQKGLNEFRLLGLDQATIRSMPNGDTRPLLVLLQHIDVVPFTNDPRFISVDQKIASNIQVNEYSLATWSVESDGDGYFYWLGEGTRQGYRDLIWSEEDTPARIKVHLLPGPSREDPARHVRISFSRYGNYQEDYQVVENFEFSSSVDFEIEVQLYRGLNQLDIVALDAATIDVLPNGDARPLIVKLTGLDILPNDE